VADARCRRGGDPGVGLLRDGRDDHVIRFCFAKNEATLAAAIA
jgi:ribosomal protein L24E